jgi:hypothetical protein
MLYPPFSRERIMKVVITEKHMVSKALCQAYEENNSDERITFICTYGITSFKYVYPKNMKWSDYPALQTPKYTPTTNSPFIRIDPNQFTYGLEYNGREKTVKTVRLTLDECRHLISTAKEIVFACDFDIRGVASFEQFINEFSPNRRGEAFEAHFLFNYQMTELRRKIASPDNTSHPAYQKLLNASMVKRYFEFNFDINSVAIFGKTYAAVNGNSIDQYISKYQLQLLFWLRNNNGISWAKLISFMATKWKGTGKYNPDDYDMWHANILGSASSHADIISCLIEKRLIERSIHEVISITNLGISFLDAVHKDCEDSDLPFRINLWTKEPFEEAKIKIDRYLNRFFSKQKRFIDRHIAK